MTSPSPIQSVRLPATKAAAIEVDVLRLDTLHPVVSGNKWFKLKAHLHEAHRRSATTILTFGGAWSNHIIATAFAAQQANIPAIGIIRGERPPILSATLASAHACGMNLEFISRKDYMQKDSQRFLEHCISRFPGVYIIPEGGAGNIGIKGSEHILRSNNTSHYTHILCAVGTGTMFLGLTAAAAPEQEIIGIPVLRGIEDIAAISRDGFPSPQRLSRCRILPGWHFGGYARMSQELLDFMNRFYRETMIPSDFVYTGKLFFAVMEMIREHLFSPGSRLLIIHSGGLQGNRSLPSGALAF
jgi:1-aminocyclopropane-1-carboxylate deaminase